jgi:prolyl-tRNA synthetase
MLLSKYFLPTRKDTSKDLVLTSHKLMVKAGLIKQISSGLYTMLPMGLKVLKKIENIVREELDSEGFHEMLMPTIQPAELWKESGRYQNYGLEMLKFKDRHGAELLYGPTAEEVATLIAKDIKSYKNLPCVLYNIQWKFRDEIRPRFALMRAREFLMMDSYSFDLTEEDAKITYNKHYDAYLRIFARLGLTAIPMQADTGEIGGDLSHEFHIIAESGESEIFYEQDLELLIDKIKTGEISSNLRENITKFYAKTEEKHNENKCQNLKIIKKRGIEVGHNFYFSTKYSSSMNFNVQDNKGNLINPFMGSYGIGIGRLMAAFVEASNDENGIIWHKNISPFDIHIVDLTKSQESKNQALKIYHTLKQNKFDVLIDETQDSAKEKFAKSNLIGIPYLLTISERLLEENSVEITERKTQNKNIIKIENITRNLMDKL